jgi:hypothetical protein
MNDQTSQSNVVTKLGLIGFSILYLGWMVFLAYLAFTLSGQ